MFEGFETRRIDAPDTGFGGTRINLRVGGSGPALLLLHGYPQTHVMWHKVASRLAAHFTLVCPDLRGYGDSGKPPPGERSVNFSKRAMAADMAHVMTVLGHDRFHVCGHDRGGRVAHRLALDHAARMARLCVLDIAPTREMYRATDRAFAHAYWHWFFLCLPHPMPERMILADPVAYLHEKTTGFGARPGVFAPEAMAEYERCFADPETVRASCDDYRAAAGIDLDHDDADEGRKVTAPLLVLWGAHGVIERCFDALALWRERAEDVRGWSIPTGHFLAEERPDDVTDALLEFFSADGT